MLEKLGKLIKGAKAKKQTPIKLCSKTSSSVCGCIKDASASRKGLTVTS